MPSIRSRLGYFLYLTRRNDRSWAALDAADKQLVLEANQLHNNVRPDYADPELYQGGRNFDSSEERLSTIEGKRLNDFLEKTKPASVVEIGPGSGFYTRTIVTNPAVKSFIAVDIVQPFLDYLQPRFETLKKEKAGFDFKLINADFLQLDLEPVDAIILFSTVHHIPNRLELLNWVSKTLKVGGSCFVFEPAHYWPRIRSLMGKYVRIYYKASHRAETAHFSTHHFCTIEEFQSLVELIPGLQISSYSFHNMDFPHFARKALNRIFDLAKIPRDQAGIYVAERRSPLRLFSQRMFVEFKKTF